MENHRIASFEEGAVAEVNEEGRFHSDAGHNDKNTKTRQRMSLAINLEKT